MSQIAQSIKSHRLPYFPTYSTMVVSNLGIESAQQIN